MAEFHGDISHQVEQLRIYVNVHFMPFFFCNHILTVSGNGQISRTYLP